jgi:hypothetical protein
MLGRNHEIIWGQETVSGAEFWSFLDYDMDPDTWDERQRWRLRNLKQGVETAQKRRSLIARNRTFEQNSMGLSWQDALQITWGACCEDPRDRIYGVLGLVDQSELVPDYSLPLEQVFRDLCQYDLSTAAFSLQDYQHNARNWRMQLGLPDSTIIPEEFFQESPKEEEWSAGMAYAPAQKGSETDLLALLADEDK